MVPFQNQQLRFEFNSYRFVYISYSIPRFLLSTDGETGVSTEVEFVMHGCFDKAPSKYELTCEGGNEVTFFKKGSLDSFSKLFFYQTG